MTKRIVNGWPNSKLRELLRDRMLVGHPERFVGDLDRLPPQTCTAGVIRKSALCFARFRQRFRRTFRSFRHVLVDSLADDSLRELLQMRMQLFRERIELWP